MLIVVDIGGSKIRVASGNSRLKVLGSRTIKTPEDSKTAVAEITRLAQELAGSEKIRAVGVAAPGPLDLKGGRILTPPNLDWRNFKIVEQLKKKLGAPVILENDANAAALAEATTGAGHGHRFVLYVTISTGIGTGFVVDGTVYHGAHDTEGGHITLEPGGPKCGCGGRGHFEALASGRAIKRDFGRYGYEIKDAATWNKIARNIAWGLADLAAMMSPDIIVLGGGVDVHWNRFHKSLAKHLAEFASPLYPLPKVVPAKHVETAALYGCLMMAAKVARD